MHINRNNRNKPIEILLIEDNQGDNRLTKEVFKEASVPNHIQIVTNGVEAMHFLNREEEYQNAAHPDLILLDLNIPKKDGREILKEIKENPELKCIPIIVLTTSQSEIDIKSTYDHFANAYITKPLDLNEFIEVIRSIEEYWLSTVELPSGCRG
ncbi:MAG: response regulator [Methanobacterium sp.]|jgi:CheY-like chemotaxis protein|nr:response regulator [Methanobacterium sp.]